MREAAVGNALSHDGGQPSWRYDQCRCWRRRSQSTYSVTDSKKDGGGAAALLAQNFFSRKPAFSRVKSIYRVAQKVSHFQVSSLNRIKNRH